MPGHIGCRAMRHRRPDRHSADLMMLKAKSRGGSPRYGTLRESKVRTCSATERRRQPAGVPVTNGMAMLTTKTIESMSSAADAVIGDVLLRGPRGMQTPPRT